MERLETKIENFHRQVQIKEDRGANNIPFKRPNSNFKQNQSFAFNEKGIPRCNFCQKLGHTRYNCFQRENTTLHQATKDVICHQRPTITIVDITSLLLGYTTIDHGATCRSSSNNKPGFYSRANAVLSFQDDLDPG